MRLNAGHTLVPLSLATILASLQLPAQNSLNEAPSIDPGLATRLDGVMAPHRAITTESIDIALRAVDPGLARPNIVPLSPLIEPVIRVWVQGWPSLDDRQLRVRGVLDSSPRLDGLPNNTDLAGLRLQESFDRFFSSGQEIVRLLSANPALATRLKLDNLALLPTPGADESYKLAVADLKSVLGPLLIVSLDPVSYRLDRSRAEERQLLVLLTELEESLGQNLLLQQLRPLWSKIDPALTNFLRCARDNLGSVPHRDSLPTIRAQAKSAQDFFRDISELTNGLVPSSPGAAINWANRVTTYLRDYQGEAWRANLVTAAFYRLTENAGEVKSALEAVAITAQLLRLRSWSELLPELFEARVDITSGRQQLGRPVSVIERLPRPAREQILGLRSHDLAVALAQPIVVPNIGWLTAVLGSDTQQGLAHLDQVIALMASLGPSQAGESVWRLAERPPDVLGELRGYDPFQQFLVQHPDLERLVDPVTVEFRRWADAKQRLASPVEKQLKQLIDQLPDTVGAERSGILNQISEIMQSSVEIKLTAAELDLARWLKARHPDYIARRDSLSRYAASRVGLTIEQRAYSELLAGKLGHRIVARYDLTAHGSVGPWLSDSLRAWLGVSRW